MHAKVSWHLLPEILQCESALPKYFIYIHLVPRYYAKNRNEYIACLFRELSHIAKFGLVNVVSPS